MKIILWEKIAIKTLIRQWQGLKKLKSPSSVFNTIFNWKEFQMTLRFTMTRRIFSKVAWFQNHKLRIERVCLTWRAALSWCAARSIIEGSVKYKLKVLNYSFRSKNMWTSLCGKMWTPPFIFPTNIHNESGIILKWVINFSEHNHQSQVIVT